MRRGLHPSLNAGKKKRRSIQNVPKITNRWGSAREKMPNKTPAIISAVLTVILLIIFGVLSIFTSMLVLNGVSVGQGMTAMGVSLVCQGVGATLAALLAAWLTNLGIKKFNWNKNLVVAIAVILGTLLGGVISFLSIIISIPLAGVR